MNPISDSAATLTPKEGFNRLAYTYDARMANHPLFRLESQAVLAVLPDLRGADVADIGCGTGRYALQLARSGAAGVVGVDIAPEMLTIAQRKAIKGGLEDIAWREGDICGDLAIESGTIDFALCALTLSFVNDLAVAFAVLSDILKPGGVLVVSDYHPYTLLQERAQNGAVFHRFMDADGLDYRILQTPHTVSALSLAARDAGLMLVEIQEPAPDRETCYSYSGLQNRVGIPLALILRFTKGK